MTPSEITLILDTLKRALKKSGWTYKKVAKNLSVSEVTIKRFFAGDDILLTRLLDISKLANFSLSDLLASALGETNQVFYLSEEQENFFCQDEGAYYFFSLLLQGKTLNEIRVSYDLSKAQTHIYLRKLEKIKVLQLGAQESFQLQVRGTLTWIKNGPLQSKSMDRRHIEYVTHFSKMLSDPAVYLASSERSLTESSLKELIDDLRFLVRKFSHRSNREEKLSSADKLISISWLLGVGPFKRDLKQYLKKP